MVFTLKQPAPPSIPALVGGIICTGREKGQVRWAGLPKRTVQIGEKQVDWQDSFRLYLVTRNPNLILPPDALALVAVPRLLEEGLKLNRWDIGIKYPE